MIFFGQSSIWLVSFLKDLILLPLEEVMKLHELEYYFLSRAGLL